MVKIHSITDLLTTAEILAYSSSIIEDIVQTSSALIYRHQWFD